MDPKPNLTYFLTYENQSVIEQAYQVLQKWSQTFSGNQVFGWQKKDHTRFVLFIHNSDVITLEQESDLVSELIKIPGLGFFCNSFN